MPALSYKNPDNNQWTEIPLGGDYIFYVPSDESENGKAITIQGGTGKITSGNALSINFPTAFTNTPQVMVQAQSSVTLYVSSVSTSGFVVDTSSTSSYNFMWVAIG